MKNICSIIGARPQFIKAGPLSSVLRREMREVIIHTGQHYDAAMSDIFFEELALPKPDYHLGIGSGPHGQQTGAMLAAIEKVLLAENPDAVIVYGDTNSTLAGALAAVKLHIPVAHIEAGLRSFNRRMPEEINRILTDHAAHWLFVPSQAAGDNLAAEGITQNVHIVGDVMLDAILQHRERARVHSHILESLDLIPGQYYSATIHRAENTDDPERLRAIFTALGALSKPVIVPLHPRTRRCLHEQGITPAGQIRFVEPLGYLDMLQLMQNAACILTDSGGIQKEAYYLKIPCITLRDETEWVETVTSGWNMLTGVHSQKIADAVGNSQNVPRLPHPDLYGTGDSAERIVSFLLKNL